jgi:lipopolysaccharide/colanic/teichoic acid biosynthesis glycosyltransferase
MEPHPARTQTGAKPAGPISNHHTSTHMRPHTAQQKARARI